MSLFPRSIPDPQHQASISTLMEQCLQVRGIHLNQKEPSSTLRRLYRRVRARRQQLFAAVWVVEFSRNY